MEEQEAETHNSESGEEEAHSLIRQHHVEDQHVLQFLDSLDGYLTLFDSLSSTLRQVKLHYFLVCACLFLSF